MRTHEEEWTTVVSNISDEFHVCVPRSHSHIQDSRTKHPYAKESLIPLPQHDYVWVNNEWEVNPTWEAQNPIHGSGFSEIIHIWRSPWYEIWPVSQSARKTGVGVWEVAHPRYRICWGYHRQQLKQKIWQNRPVVHTVLFCGDSTERTVLEWTWLFDSMIYEPRWRSARYAVGLTIEYHHGQSVRSRSDKYPYLTPAQANRGYSKIRTNKTTHDCSKRSACVRSTFEKGRTLWPPWWDNPLNARVWW